MVNDMKDLMRENVATAPPDHVDLGAVMRIGRSRRRKRRSVVAAGAASLLAGAVAVTVVSLPQGTDHTDAADGPPKPDAPTVRLADAERAMEGSDYSVLASYTNENLNRDNGQYLDGVTDDGLILFRDGPRRGQLWPRMALMDPATGEKEWLPDLRIGQTQTWPVELGADRLVLASASGGMRADLVVHIYDRTAGSWSTRTWPTLPRLAGPGGVLGPDGRMYVAVPATQGRVPEGGWPTGPDGEADDADAEGDTYRLWSVDLTDSADVRDEGLTVGSFVFTDSMLVWTDSTNGDAGRVHVRDLSTGEEHAFDPQAGEKCNLLSFGATDDRVVMGQYCGTYAGGVRDDRVQILTTDGEQVATIQDSGMDGMHAGPGSDLVPITSYDKDLGGTYVYDLGSDELLRLSDAVSGWWFNALVPDGVLAWNTPVNNRRGATQWLAEMLP